MKRLAMGWVMICAVVGFCLPAHSDDGPEMTRAGAWYRSSEQTEPVQAGQGYFCVRMVQAQLVTGRPGWFTSLLTGNKGTRQIFACMQFGYGDTSLQSPIAWGEVQPDKPRLPQNRLQVTPWLPVVTKAGAPLQPKLSVMLRSVPVTGGGILSALRMLAEHAATAGPLATFAQSTDVVFTYQDLFEQVFGAFTPQKTTPTSVTFDLAAGDRAQEVRFSRYLLVTDADAKLQRTRNGKTESFRWDEWEQHLKVPGEGSTSPYVVWSDTGEPVTEVSFVLLAIDTLPQFFSDFESVHAAPELYKTIYKLVVMPLTSALEGKTDEAEIATTLRTHLDQLREWLWAEQAGISMRDIETICKVVADKALADSGVAEITPEKGHPRSPFPWEVQAMGMPEAMPGVEFPESARPEARPGLHRVEGWE